MRYELTDFEWAAIRSFLPNKPRGIPSVGDRRVLNGIFWSCARVLPGAICRRPMVPVTRFVQWRRAGVWERITAALAAGHDPTVQMIDPSIVRVHQHRSHRDDPPSLA